LLVWLKSEPRTLSCKSAYCLCHKAKATLDNVKIADSVHFFALQVLTQTVDNTHKLLFGFKIKTNQQKVAAMSSNELLMPFWDKVKAVIDQIIKSELNEKRYWAWIKYFSRAKSKKPLIYPEIKCSFNIKVFFES